jgi:phosphate transport system substrate-binding protein
MKIFINIIFCLFWGLIVLTIGIFCAGMTVLTTGKAFYGYVIGAFFIGLFAYSIISTYGPMKKKRINQVFVIFTIICTLAISGYAINEKVKKSIPTVSDKIVNLNEYKPFEQATKAVSLEETSSLMISDNVPRLDGATALYPVYSSFARAVYPEKDYQLYESEVMCTTTEDAYRRLIDGSADIIFAAQPSKEQLEIAKIRGVELKLTPIGREAFVFFVNSKNKIEGLATKEIQGIYSGEITNWKSVGGGSSSIRAFQRPKNSGSQTMLQKLMEGRNLMVPPSENIVSAMGGIIDKTSDYKNYKNAIGYSFLFYATEMVKNNQIKLLKVDGVYPSRDTIKNKQYPLSSEFYAITAGSKNPNIEPFIKWILGRQGQYLIEKTGYTPLNAVN